MEASRHYPCRVRHRNELNFIVWRSDEHDDFLRNTNGQLVSAPDLKSLAANLHALGVLLENVEPTDYDFDRIQNWCAAPDADGIDCPEFLNAWNFFDDLAGLQMRADTPYTRLSRNAEVCYDRLFWGSNLPAMIPPGRRFDPVWSAEDLNKIRAVMLAGLEMLDAALRFRSK
jgi:hypothetical protein